MFSRSLLSRNICETADFFLKHSADKFSDNIPKITTCNLTEDDPRAAAFAPTPREKVRDRAVNRICRVWWQSPGLIHGKLARQDDTIGKRKACLLCFWTMTEKATNATSHFVEIYSKVKQMETHVARCLRLANFHSKLMDPNQYMMVMRW